MIDIGTNRLQNSTLQKGIAWVCRKQSKECQKVTEVQNEIRITTQT